MRRVLIVENQTLLGAGVHSLLGDETDLDIRGISPHDQTELIRDIGPGGGYILTSGNSLAGYLRPENVLAMSAAVQKYGHYPLDL